MHALKAYIAEKKDLLASHMAKYLQSKKGSLNLAIYEESLDKLIELAPQGKMLRGVLLILASEIFGKLSNTQTLNAAAGLQIACDGLLYHDDFMDNSYSRRGSRSLFAQYMDEGKKRGSRDALLYGQSLAVCIGNITFFFGMELVADGTDDPTILRKLVHKFSTELQTVGAGQMHDIEYAMTSEEPSDEHVYEIYRYKTAHYTCVLPLSMGAIIAGTHEGTVKIVEELGEKLGLIFQLKDDELDLYGDEKITGKPVGGDIKENKKTLWRNRLYAKVKASDRTFLDTCFGNPNLDHSQIKKIITLTESYGVKQEIEEQKKQLAAACNEIINNIECQQKYKDILAEFVAYNVNRVK